MYWLVCNRCDRSKACDFHPLCESCRAADRAAARHARSAAIARVVTLDLGIARRPLIVLASTGLLAGVGSAAFAVPYLLALAVLVSGAVALAGVLVMLELVS